MTDPSILVGYKQPDDAPPTPPGPRRAPFWLWLLTLLLLGGVVFLQQNPPGERPARPDPWAAATGENVQPPRVSTTILMGRMVLAAKRDAPQLAPQLLQSIEEQTGIRRSGPEATPPALVQDSPQDAADAPAEFASSDTPPPPSPPPSDPLVPTTDADGARARGQRAPPPAQDRFRVAILAAEIEGPDSALHRFDLLEEILAPDSPLHADIAAARTIYEAGADELDQSEREGLVDRHGWFGRLLLTYGEPPTDPFRAQEAQSARVLMLVFASLGLLVLTALLVGLAILVILLVLVGGGNLRPAFVRPWAGWAGERLWLETFAVFLAGFLGLKLIVWGVLSLAPQGAAWTAWFSLGSQWALLLLVFWPVYRGMSFRQFRGEVGWHRGRGFFKECGAGIIGYVAALPVYLLMALLIALAMLLRERAGGGEPPIPDNRVLEALEHADLGLALLLGSLVVLWAPIVEETIFRGALYRVFRSPLGVIGAVLATAIIFAVMHAYILAGLVMVATLGAAFGLMREWRGSIIAPMVAHGIHNGFVLTLMLTVLHFSRG